MDTFETLMGPGGTLVNLGITHADIVAAVQRLRYNDYKLEATTRHVKTGMVDLQNNPITCERVTIEKLQVRPTVIPGLLESLAPGVDHPTLRAARFRAYESERVTEELTEQVTSGGSNEVRMFAKHAARFAKKLSQIPDAKNRKEALKLVCKAFEDALSFTSRDAATGSIKVSTDQNQLMHTAFFSVKSLLQGDAHVTKCLHKLCFSDTPNELPQVSPDCTVIKYRSRKRGVQTVRVPDILSAELHKLRKIRAAQGTNLIFIRAKKKGSAPMSYSALSKWATRFKC